jgi:HemY protein
MRGLLWLLTLFALAVGISLAARYNDGYVLLVFPPYRAEISLNLALLLVLGGFSVLYGLLRAVALALALPNRVRAFRALRRSEKAAGVFHDAIRLLFEGRYSQSLKKAGEAHAAGQSPGIAALVAARSAQRLHEPAKQQYWLDRASVDDPQMHSARLMLEAEMHLDARRFADAVDALQRLQKSAGRHIAALRLELRAQQGCGHWDEVLRIARLLEKREGLLPELAQEIKLKAHQENIRLRQADRAALLAYLRQMPASESSPRLARTFAAALIEQGAHDAAQELIETQLDRQDVEWDSALIRLYGRRSGGNPVARIARADQWLRQHPGDPQLLLVLGRLCLVQRLWGKAQTYFEAALSVAPQADQREIRLELAHLFEQTGRADEAMRHYRAAVESLV